MNQQHLAHLSTELSVAPHQVQATAQLLEDGGTVPFIARYRKEATGSLDETVITAIRDRLAQLETLDKRREAILKSLEEQGKLTDDLRAGILQAQTLVAIEDLYLPFRPKRRTRAAKAREKGLEPLARLILAQDPATRPVSEAKAFISTDTGVSSIEEALAGARDIIAEWVNENPDARARLRDLFNDRGRLRSRVIAGKESEGILYRDYYEWDEAIGKIPSHRILATRRGDKEGFLTVHIVPPEETAWSILESIFVTGDTAASQEVKAAVADGYKRLLAPSLETEAKQSLKERADRDAIQIFAENLRHLLMAAPLGARRTMAIDPGFRTGCKLVCLDPQGKLTHNETIYPHTGEQASAKAAERVRTLAASFAVEVIAIGNGTAGRETESFVRSLDLPKSIQVVMVDESGASIYSASPVAREEFPDHDITVRGAVSIGRRLMDPLAELVKIDPKSIGVGQYQHDVDPGELKNCLDDIVMSCVNAVGVQVNTASPQLLGYVSGLGAQLARNIMAYRNENGPFRSREELRKVPRLGPKAFQQAAGFLRISDGGNPLDASAVHPESYGIVQAMARDLACTMSDLMRDANLRAGIDPARYVTEAAGLPTLRDILSELAKPGRDPRQTFEPFSFVPGIEQLADLKAGMRLPGIVTNVTAFGAFVDIGVHRDGLVHLSELSDTYVTDPRQVVRVHQHVSVTVLEVDLERNRIALSMKSSAAPSPGPSKSPTPASTRTRAEQPARSAKKSAFNNPFEAALKKR
jgi:protein Tex